MEVCSSGWTVVQKSLRSSRTSAAATCVCWCLHQTCSPPLGIHSSQMDAKTWFPLPVVESNIPCSIHGPGHLWEATRKQGWSLHHTSPLQDRCLQAAHESSGLPKKQCLTGPSQHQLCNTTWQLRLIFCGTFPPYISVSFFIHRRSYIH